MIDTEEQEAIRRKIGPPKNPLERLEWALATYEDADPITKPLLRSNLQDAAVLVLEERRRLRAKLDRQGLWFDANPDHEETDAKMETFLRTLAKYETAEQLSARATLVLRCRS
jgi:hypothetical protein